MFLGNGKYFVSSDVGGGKMQWYGFHKEAAGELPNEDSLLRLATSVTPLAWQCSAFSFLLLPGDSMACTHATHSA